MTDDPDLTTVTSVLDYVFRRLALDFLDADTAASVASTASTTRRQLTAAGSVR